MATDPTWQREEKRRREAQAREADARRAWQAGYTRQVPSDLMPEHVEYANRGRTYNPTPRQRELVRAGVEEGTRTPLARPPANVRFRDQEVISPNPERRRAQGLTRVVKTADGAYTDAPGAEGTVRYYDAMGTRVDAAPVQGSLSRRIGPREANRIMDQNQYDFAANPDLEQAAVDQGRRSLRTLAQRNAEGAARQQALERYMMSEDNRRALEQTELEQLGEDRRASAANEAALIAAQIQAQDAERDRALKAGEALRDREVYERELDRETPGALAAEQLALLENLTPEERALRLANPDDDVSGLARASFRRSGMARGLGPDFSPGQVTRAGPFRRFLHSPLTLGFTAPRYDANDGAFLDTLFDPDDIIPGASSEDLEALIEADRLANVRRRRLGGG